MNQEQLKEIKRKLQQAKQTTMSVEDRLNQVRIRMDRLKREVAK